jgi:hypothetical protein
VAQLGARLDGIEEVVGSNPIGSTNNKMADSLQYHNPDVMGPFQPSTIFAIVTNKRGGLREGDTVWLVTGEGRPREYFLCETFVVESIASRGAEKFRYRVSSANGKSLYPLKLDRATPWFQQLMKLTGNFRYGLQPIKNQSIVEALQRFSE